MGSSISGKAFNLNALFEKPFYQIDYYQREYAWSADDVRTLVTDLFTAFDEHWQDGRRRWQRTEPEHFFLGPFVYVEESRGVRFLVDGQQRFTTLHLLFMHLRRIADSYRQPTTVDKLNRVIGEFNGNRLRFRIDIDERREFLTRLYNGVRFELDVGAPISVRNMSFRSGLIKELLDQQLTAESCAPFVDWLLNHAVLIGIKAGNKASGFKIFESMNDRGARLTSADLVKSFLISQVGAHQDELNERWRKMLARVTTDREDANAPKEFLKAALIAHYASMGDESSADMREIEEALNIWVRKKAEARVGLKTSEDYFTFVNDLIYLSEHYVRFKKALSKPYLSDNLEAVYYNAVNGLTNQLQLVLAAVRPRDTATDAKSKARLVANYLDRLYVSRMLSDQPLGARDFEAEYRVLIPQLRMCETEPQVAETLAAALPPESFQAIYNFQLRGNNKAQVRYLLTRLTAYVEVGCGKHDLSAEYLNEDRAWQVEHLWPNHPDWYNHEIPERGDFLVLRARIGSLVLLHRKDNASLNDMRFHEKIQRYGRQNNLTAVLDPGHRRNNTFIRDFVNDKDNKDNDLGEHFHDFGTDPKMQTVVASRTELYRRLCQIIWKPQRLGFPTFEPPELAEPARQNEPAPPPRRRPTPNARTAIARMMKHGILPDGVPIFARASNYRATIDGDGIIWLPTGDAFVSVDEAGRAVSGLDKCDGLDFWQVTGEDGATNSLRIIHNNAKADGRLASTQRRR
ncbi:hypothetical protein Ait01nite_091260 [Actinoplanes italicus]|jgi:hypothetical protein|uniref:Uncharacterized protein with ParB-like and HNH nuclease domain n=1 Tax=Actinoplanes italicus TaxID=113567 RepID=A0A2T0JSC1_9ACTN|nr:DUF262 domain-containing protein [Actinoplanes italicus]PRX10527.1 uncharacterized protein with ParB-like and HNH nuclease domain [Actinoplanes italicus]GIE36081.1 hypothetical protein Ait01nite_091260 [Actinoplanes italicus]